MNEHENLPLGVMTVNPIRLKDYATHDDSKQDESHTEKPECPICFKILEKKDWVADLSCGHPACFMCVHQHIQLAGRSCSVCRTTYNVAGFI